MCGREERDKVQTASLESLLALSRSLSISSCACRLISRFLWSLRKCFKPGVENEKKSIEGTPQPGRRAKKEQKHWRRLVSLYLSLALSLF